MDKDSRLLAEAYLQVETPTVAIVPAFIIKHIGKSEPYEMEFDSQVYQHTYGIFLDGKQVGEFTGDTYFGMIHGTLFGKNLPDFSRYQAAGFKEKFDKFIKSNTGQKFMQRIPELANKSSAPMPGVGGVRNPPIKNDFEDNIGYRRSGKSYRTRIDDEGY